MMEWRDFDLYIVWLQNVTLNNAKYFAECC